MTEGREYSRVPKPRNPDDLPTLWLDYTTASGVSDTGRVVTAQSADLFGMLDLARAEGATRVMVSGRVPGTEQGERPWVEDQAPGWVVSGSGHFISDLRPAVGRYRPAQSTSGKDQITVREVREWFGTNALNPRQAQRAWDRTQIALGGAIHGARMFMAPSVTGQEAWLRTLYTRSRHTGAFTAKPEAEALAKATVSDDLAYKIWLSGRHQHREENFCAGDERCDCGDCQPLVTADTIGGFAYADGRFMYAGRCRELGTGGREITAGEVMDLWSTREGRQARARYLVDVVVPAGWDHAGLLPVAHTVREKGWHYPNRPGARFTAWADAVEVDIAMRHGWDLTPIEGLLFDKWAPLDTWVRALVTAREKISAVTAKGGGPGEDPAVVEAVRSALRAIVLQGIGGFAHRAGSVRKTVTDPFDIPEDLVGGAQQNGDGSWSYTAPGRPKTARDRFFYRPELAGQVWARSRACLLEAPTAHGSGQVGGLLEERPEHVLAVQGDAIYVDYVPWWVQPVTGRDGTTIGGGDDGKVGRFRLKGVAWPEDMRSGKIPRPGTRETRFALRNWVEGKGLGDF